MALSEGILKNGEPAVKKYLEFLHMGGSAYPLDELRHAGVDLTTPPRWMLPWISSAAFWTKPKPAWHSWKLQNKQGKSRVYLKNSKI